MREIRVIIVLTLLLCSGAESLLAQATLKEIPLKRQIEKSSLVVEGKVVSKRSFWDANHQHIYTANTIKIYKVFKGSLLEVIEIITPGGVVGFNAEVVTPSLKLREGDVGIFTLRDNYVGLSAESKSVNKKYQVYSSLQGFYKYNVLRNTVVNPFSIKKGISEIFYNEIKRYTKLPFAKVSDYNVKETHAKSVQSKGSLDLGITSFSPTTASAGIKDELVIIGTDFGAIQGKVGFSNADDGGATFVFALDSQVIKWEDTEIIVEIPSGAGTGQIVVQDATTPTAINTVSSNDLTILYSELTIDYDPDDDTGDDPPGLNGPLGVYAFAVRHVDSDGSGGYIWKKTLGFEAVTGAEASFTRAMDTWRCETKINWTIGPTAVGDSAAPQNRAVKDGVNIIAFDNNTSAEPLDDLPDGVGGACTSYYSGCGSALDIKWFIRELDIVFDDEVNWVYGEALATTGEFDFESVALHELGHGHQLGHVIDPGGAVMHWTIGNGANIRDLASGDIEAANNVQVRSEASSPFCFSQLTPPVSPMTAYAGSCSLGINDNQINTTLTIYPNPSKGIFYINTPSSVTLERAVVYDLSGRLIQQYDILNASKVKTIKLGESISKGIYFLNLYSKDAVLAQKIVLE
jgi:hypothetical protein